MKKRMRNLFVVALAAVMVFGSALNAMAAESPAPAGPAQLQVYYRNGDKLVKVELVEGKQENTTDTYHLFDASDLTLPEGYVLAEDATWFAKVNYGEMKRVDVQIDLAKVSSHIEINYVCPAHGTHSEKLDITGTKGEVIPATRFDFASYLEGTLLEGHEIELVDGPEAPVYGEAASYFVKLKDKVATSNVKIAYLAPSKPAYIKEVEVTGLPGEVVTDDLFDFEGYLAGSPLSEYVIDYINGPEEGAATYGDPINYAVMLKEAEVGPCQAFLKMSQNK